MVTTEEIQFPVYRWENVQKQNAWKYFYEIKKYIWLIFYVNFSSSSIS